MSRDEQIDAAIAAFNANRPIDQRARRPILATDCDYEIVSISGVQGRRLQS